MAPVEGTLDGLGPHGPPALAHGPPPGSLCESHFRAGAGTYADYYGSEVYTRLDADLSSVGYGVYSREVELPPQVMGPAERRASHSHGGAPPSQEMA